MSCIHLHLGQAGNQIGKAFWGLAEEEYLVEDKNDSAVAAAGRGRASGGRSTPTEAARVRGGDTMAMTRPGAGGMFHYDGFARCLAVDSEPKVVQRFQEQVPSLRPENALYSHSGLANNWAKGFASCRDDGCDVAAPARAGSGEGEGLFDRCMDALRREAERCCWLNSVVMNHSLAGGTGSGLGSGLLQALRDEYPSIYLVSVCVGAFRAGESPLQHYNSALALHHLQAFADAIIYRGNDDLLQKSKPTTTTAAAANPVVRERGRRSHHHHYHHHHGSGGGGGGGGAVSTVDMNHALSLDMASYFFPTTNLLPSSTTQDDPLFYRSGSGGGGGGGDRKSRQRNHNRPPEPAGTGTGRRWDSAPRNFDGGSLMAAACPLPAAKVVDLRSTLSSSSLSSSAAAAASACSDWAGFAGSLGKTSALCPRRNGGETNDACVAAHQVLRGVQGPGARSGASASRGERDSRVRPAAAAAAADGGYSKKNGVESGVLWAPEVAEVSAALRRYHECADWRTATEVSYLPVLSRRGVTRSVTTVCNQTRIRWVLGDVVRRAEEKFRAKAYLHWYRRHGLEDEDFIAAFEGVRTMQRGYDGLAKALGGGGGGGAGGRGSQHM